MGDSSSSRVAPLLRAAAAASSPFVTTEAARMEIEALRAELEHERSLRALEARRAQQTRVRLEQHLDLAAKEAKETKAVLEETQRESEIHMEQLRDARNDALQQLRQIQNASLEDENERDVLEQQAEMAREKQRLLESQLSAMTQEVESLRHEMLLEQQQKERAQEHDDDGSENNVSPQKILEPSGSLAPTAVLKELNRTRLLLAESERKHRQLVRKSDEWQQRSKQYVQQQEAARISSFRINQLETQLRNETKELEALRAQNSSWISFGKSLNRALRQVDKQSPAFSDTVNDVLPPETAKVMRLFEKAQMENQRLQQEIESLQQELETSRAHVSSSQQELKTSQAEIARSKEQLEEVKGRLQQTEFDVQTMRAQEGIWKREAESLRSLMKTYDDETVVTKKSTAKDSSTPPITTKGMELSLANAQDEIRLLTEERSRLSAQVESLQTQQAELRTEHERVVEKFGRLKNALNEEKQKAQVSEERACKAEALAGKGHFNADETRVLHLKQNPLTEAIKERYEQEISALNKRLQEATGDKATKAKRTSTTPEVDPHKLHTRLKESFKEQIGLFREGVYLMTGYKVDMLPKTDRPTFRVRSVYAERESDHLMFVWPKSSSDEAPSSLDLMDTEQAKILATTDSYAYMTKYNSLPAFLASVQLNLFEKQTLV